MSIKVKDLKELLNSGRLDDDETMNMVARKVSEEDDRWEFIMITEKTHVVVFYMYADVKIQVIEG